MNLRLRLRLYTAGIDSVRPRQKGRAFFPIPFFGGFHLWKSVRASVRPGAQRSSIGRFCLTERGGFEKEIPFRTLAVKSVILFSQKVIHSKNMLPPVNVYFFVKFTTVVLPAVSPQRGLTVK